MGIFAENKGKAKERFTACVDELIKAGKETGMEVQERIAKVDALCEEYVADMGQTPNHTELDRLATFILGIELDAQFKPKNEFPINSERQEIRRAKRQAPFVEY